ncbi:hypothetical protein Droror1_Dr00024944 [Drosera rotundifolia]
MSAFQIKKTGGILVEFAELICPELNVPEGDVEQLLVSLILDNRMDSCRKLSSSINETSSDEDQVISSNHRRRRCFQRMTHLALSAQIFQQCSQQVARRIIVRDREETHQQIMRDYFDENCTYPAVYFCRRF